MIHHRKRRLVALGLAAALVSVMAFALSQPATAGPPARPAAQGDNLLQNPGFEGAFHAWSGINELQVADGWTPWWWEDPNHNPAYFRPEYKRAVAYLYPNRVLAGESSQQWFTFHASHYAGMYQQVFNVQPGTRYRFTIWAQVWSSIEDDPNISVLPANPHLRVGIDPTGNWNPGSGDVVWSGEGPMSSHIDQWAQISVEATASNGVITVFMRTNPDFANKHNDMYWDNASLVAVGPPPPPPTNTPLPATDTPLASNTPISSNTPVATETPEASETPKPTDTPEPTATSAPTDTPAPSDTPTSAPTDTPAPVSPPTEEPTNTPAATEVAASATAAPSEEPPAGDGTVTEDGSSPVTGLVLIGLGVVLGLILAGGVLFMRRGN